MRLAHHRLGFCLLPVLLSAATGGCSPTAPSGPTFAYTDESTNGSLPSVSWGSGSSGGSETESGEDSGNDSGAAADAVTGTGYSTGDTAYDLSATNQFGRIWSLYAQQGQAVLLLLGNADVGAALTTPLQAMSGVGGVQTVLLLGRDEYSTIADQSDAIRYAADYSLDTVLLDPFQETLVQWGGESAPRLYLIDPDLRIHYAAYGGAVTETTLQAQVQDLLGTP